MAPPTQLLNLDVEAISGICGSISIACWVVVFSPQIVENFRRGGADGLSVQFIIVWLLGDVFNIMGAVMQGVLPTMVILAFYYTLADFVLLGQCFYYRGFTWRDAEVPSKPKRRVTTTTTTSDVEPPSERSRLLSSSSSHQQQHAGALERRGSDWSHLSPAVPLAATDIPLPPPPPSTRLQAVAFNLLAVLMVCAAGVAGWWLSRGYGSSGKPDVELTDPSESTDDGLTLNFWGQIFGWLCAALYLGSRLPQLLLNWRRKSTDGVSMLFFLFACLGNLTYVMSILAYDPVCEGSDGECKAGEAAGIYWQYILVNLSWLAGSAGTLLLDLGIFWQFFMYSGLGDDESDGEYESGSDEEESVAGDDRWDERPVLQRNISDM
ncbi:PQ loop repeat-domain-containing protein [Bombardia bombarda]|uniref:PQ loop repeat-domain-containing protein n=1 Tax=Bombardia bombarda TaxID=252184 RepID=A0AA40CAS8_9PEZI|nr:PQ loop repeat-domain-containing protein [Bombardia bombarda]